MAKQIIILERTDNNRFTVAFWLSVPTARQPFYADATLTSAYKQASAPEISAIQSGAIVEQTVDMAFLQGTSLTAVKALLVTEFTARQAAVTAWNPWDRYGSFYDGSAWTAGGVS
jgi:hypothetical protein